MTPVVQSDAFPSVQDFHGSREFAHDGTHQGLGGAWPKRRDITFSYLGLTNLITREDITGYEPGTKAYTYDAYGHRIDMTDDPSGTAGPDHYTYGYDPHGSVSLLLQDGNQAKATYGYKPYGLPDETLTEGDAGGTNEKAPVNPYRYTGRRIDPISDAYDMGARRFGPDVSKFLQPDLFMNALADLTLSVDPLTRNRYSLAGGNPVSFVEWDGHMVAADNTGNGSMNPAPLAGGDVGGGSSGSGEANVSENPELAKVSAASDGPTQAEFSAEQVSEQGSGLLGVLADVGALCECRQTATWARGHHIITTVSPRGPAQQRWILSCFVLCL